MSEVVVTALGISREKKALGYAVQDVKNDVIERTGNTDLAGAMQGKLSGIDIKPQAVCLVPHRRLLSGVPAHLQGIILLSMLSMVCQ